MKRKRKIERKFGSGPCLYLRGRGFLLNVYVCSKKAADGRRISNGDALMALILLTHALKSLWAKSIWLCM